MPHDPVGNPGIPSPPDEFLRQRELLLPQDLEGQDVEVVGAGALGGAIVLCLAKMGFGIHNKIVVSDFDRCEVHNLPTQWFRTSHVQLEQTKVEALSETIAWVCDRSVETIAKGFRGDESRPLGPIVILAIDSLAERRRIWQRLQQRRDVRLLVDPRMGSEVVEIFGIDLAEAGGAALAEYGQSLEGAALEEPCTRRSIVYTALGASACVGSLVRAWIRGEPWPRHLVFDWHNFLVSTTWSTDDAR